MTNAMDAAGVAVGNGRRMDAATMAIVANRLDAIVREMTATLLRAGRSAVINVARDFSCSIVTGDDHLLAAAEGLPIHVFGSHLQTAEMRRVHSDLREGDVVLDNDPYVGGTHHADHTLMAPVFVDGQHLFTAVAKAHQADIGNASPTTYMPFARDVYEEGALSFPCVLVQRDYRDVEDVIRMCRRRIRVPEQWYGDYLAMLGSVRTGERRLKELVAKYDVETVREFVAEWFDYSERRMVNAISRLPSGRYVGEGGHDSFGPHPRIPLTVAIDVDAEAGRIRVDLTDNVDCVPTGLNLSRATSTNAVIAGLSYVLDPDVPHNAGSFRRIEVRLRENCVVGIPRHPTSCSMATTNVSDRLINATASALGDSGGGVAEGGVGLGIGAAAISGTDVRTGAPFVNNIIVGNNGGPASSCGDGWLTYGLPCVGGLVYRDSVEIDEQKYPVHFEYVRLRRDSGGAGRFRGGLSAELAFTSKGRATTVLWNGDGHEQPPRGVHGGLDGTGCSGERRLPGGAVEALPSIGQIDVHPGELIRGIGSSGGGFGDPLERDVERVLADVLEGWVSIEQARDVYGVVLAGAVADETLRVDLDATAARRRAQAG